MTLAKKLLWGAFALALAEIAALAYVITRPFPYPEDSARLKDEEESSATVESLTAAHRHRLGEVSDEEWETVKAGLLT